MWQIFNIGLRAEITQKLDFWLMFSRKSTLDLWPHKLLNAHSLALYFGLQHNTNTSVATIIVNSTFTGHLGIFKHYITVTRKESQVGPLQSVTHHLPCLLDRTRQSHHPARNTSLLHYFSYTSSYFHPINNHNK